MVEALKLLRLTNSSTTTQTLFPSQEDLLSSELMLRVNTCSVYGMGKEGLSGSAVLWPVCCAINSPDYCPRPMSVCFLLAGSKLRISLGEDHGWSFLTCMLWLTSLACMLLVYSALAQWYGPICSLTPRNLSNSSKFQLFVFSILIDLFILHISLSTFS